MPDFSPQAAAQTHQSLQSSLLSQRLNRRRTEPLGVINLRQFQNQYVGLPGWIAQRSALLNQLQTRHNSREDELGESARRVFLTLPQGASAEPAPNFPPLAQSFAARAESAAPVKRSASVPLPTEKFRVSRKATLLMAKPDASSFQKPESAPAFSEVMPAEQSNPAAIHSGKHRHESLGAEIMTIATNQAVSSARKSENWGDRPDDLPASEVVMPAAAGAASIQHPARTSAREVPLVLRKVLPSQPEARQREPMILAAGNQAIAFPTRFTPAVTPTTTDRTADSKAEPTEAELPLLRFAKPESPSLLVQQQPEAASVENGSSMTKAASHSDSDRVAVAAEIPAHLTPGQQQSLVWRQTSDEASSENFFSAATTSGTTTALPLAIHSVNRHGQRIARQPEIIAPTIEESADKQQARESIKTMNMNLMPAPAQASVPAREINVGQIAEQVSRILCRQLSVERERRGISR